MKIPTITSSMLGLVFTIMYCANCVASLEPITTGIAVGAAAVGSAFFATLSGGLEKLQCHFVECCDSPWIQANMSGLESSLNSRLHGQHLVKNTVIRSLRSHLKNKEPSKALVLSFHGSTGSGKNFVSRLIAEHLYKEGMKSQFVHLFISTHHFKHVHLLNTYQDQLSEWIRGNVSRCARTLFIFDELDKMPQGLIDSIKPFIDHYQEINGVDYRRSIFLFLSNTAGSLITRKTLDHWRSGDSREQLALKEMEEVLYKGAFNIHGGLHHSDILEKHLVDAYIPFLPMEKHHVRMCVRDDFRAKGLSKVSDATVEKVLDELQFYPPGVDLYSKTGCKRVSQKVDLIMEDINEIKTP